jgi:chemotaxis response regulator CheB
MERALQERHWDVICMDYALPSFDALGALAMRANLAPDTPVIIVSGHIGAGAAHAAHRPPPEPGTRQPRLPGHRRRS